MAKCATKSEQYMYTLSSELKIEKLDNRKRDRSDVGRQKVTQVSPVLESEVIKLEADCNNF